MNNNKFDNWKQDPMTQMFFKAIKAKLILNRSNMIDTLSTLNNVDINEKRIIFAVTEQILDSILNCTEEGIVNDANSFSNFKINFKKSIKEVLDVD